MLSVWLYAYASGITSARRIERRLVEDLAFRYLAGEAAGGQLGAVGISAAAWAGDQRGLHPGAGDGARFGLGQAGASGDRLDAGEGECLPRPHGHGTETAERAREVAAAGAALAEGLRWRRGGTGRAAGGVAAEQRLAEMPRRLEKLRKSGQAKLSRSDEEARFLRERGGHSTLGYTAEVAVSDDHFILAQRVTQAATDNDSLLPMLDEVERQCGSPPLQVLADSGYFSLQNLKQLEERGVDGYVPDSNLARELNTGQRARGLGANPVRTPQLRRMRRKLRSPAGRQQYARRKAVVEPVFGVLKQQRGMRQFRTRGLAKVAVEFTLAALAYNLTRLYQLAK